MTSQDYSAPVAHLRTLGDPGHYTKKVEEWENYTRYGIGPEHIPELIRMVLDEELMWADGASPDVYAAAHAARALGRLGAAEAAGPLLGLLRHLDPDQDYTGVTEWIYEELPGIYAAIADAGTMELLDRYLDDKEGNPERWLGCAKFLGEIGLQRPELSGRCIEMFITRLQQGARQDRIVNGEMVCGLLDLKVREAMPLIREAFANGWVDTQMVRLESAEYELGFREKPPYPRAMRSLLDETEPGMPFQRPAPKIGRNDPCPCGSGKKYKKCCLGKEGAA